MPPLDSVAFAHHRHPNPWDNAPPWAIELGWQLYYVRRALQQEGRYMAQMDDAIQQLKDDVAASKGAEDSAITLIRGFSAKLDEAVVAARAAGATDAQLADLNALHTAITSDTDALAAEVAANP